MFERRLGRLLHGLTLEEKSIQTNAVNDLARSRIDEGEDGINEAIAALSDLSRAQGAIPEQRRLFAGIIDTLTHI